MRDPGSPGEERKSLGICHSLSLSLCHPGLLGREGGGSGESCSKLHLLPRGADLPMSSATYESPALHQPRHRAARLPEQQSCGSRAKMEAYTCVQSSIRPFIHSFLLIKHLSWHCSRSQMHLERNHPHLHGDAWQGFVIYWAIQNQRTGPGPDPGPWGFRGGWSGLSLEVPGAAG